MEKSRIDPSTRHPSLEASPSPLKDTLAGMCRDAHDVLGWGTSLLLINDESTGLSCLVAASGINEDLREILLGAGVGATEEIYQWLQEHSRISRSYLLDRLGHGSPFALDNIAGGAVEAVDPAGKAVVVPIEVRGRLSGALAVYDVRSEHPVSIAQVKLLEMVASHASALIEQAMGLESLVDEIDARVARALTQSEEAVVLLNGQGLVIWANTAAERTFGPGLIPLAGLPGLAVDSDALRLKQALDKALDGSAQALEIRTRGETRDLFLTVSPAGRDAHGVFILVLAREVSAEHPRAHVSSQHLRMQPLLSVTRSYGEHFQAALRQLGDEVRENPLGAAFRFIRHESALVERMLRAGKSRPDRVFEPVDLNRVVKEAVELTRPKWETDARLLHVSYDVRFESTQEALVHGCVSELREIFVSLIEHAIESQPRGGEVILQAVVRKGLVGVQISDAASGMTDDDRLRVFDPKITTRPDGTAGLGLASSYAAIVRHGGRLSVRNSGERGNSYQVVLPVAEAGKAAVRTAPPGRLAIVMVGDQSLRLQCESTLEAAGIDFMLAFDNREVALGIENHGPDVIVIDEQSVRDHGERLTALCRDFSGAGKCIVLTRELPVPPSPLAGNPGVVILPPELLADLSAAIEK